MGALANLEFGAAPRLEELDLSTTAYHRGAGAGLLSEVAMSTLGRALWNPECGLKRLNLKGGILTRTDELTEAEIEGGWWGSPVHAVAARVARSLATSPGQPPRLRPLLSLRRVPFLVDALGSNASLTHLDLHGVDFDFEENVADAATSLSEALLSNRTLRWLRLGEGDFDPLVIEAACGALGGPAVAQQQRPAAAAAAGAGGSRRRRGGASTAPTPPDDPHPRSSCCAVEFLEIAPYSHVSHNALRALGASVARGAALETLVMTEAHFLHTSGLEPLARELVRAEAPTRLRVLNLSRTFLGPEGAASHSASHGGRPVVELASGPEARCSWQLRRASSLTSEPP